MTPEARKARVRWILAHRIWGHPMTPTTLPNFATSRPEDDHTFDPRRDSPIMLHADGTPVIYDFHQSPYECIMVEYVYVDRR
jgi:hypothetical protein